MSINGLFLKVFDKFGAARKLAIVDGDSLPARLPWRDIVITRDDGESWSVGFKCPCGCRRTIELLVMAEAKPRWDVAVDTARRPTLNPSVWLKDGCKSHFWVREGRIVWAKN